MRRIRFSIAGLMFAVAISALLVAALRSGSVAWAGAVLLLVDCVLGLGIIGALCRQGSERACWLGFAVFGCGYMVLAFWSETNFDNLPTTTLLIYLGSKFDPNIGQVARSSAGSLRWTYFQIAHGLWALVAALLGGSLARLLFVVSEHPREPPTEESHAGGGMRLNWLRRPAVIWLSGVAVVGLAAAAGSRAAPGLWAGLVFLLTCGLLGAATLGALVGRGPGRAIWLGAALFGCGYMYFTFGRSADAGWPYPPTTHLLNALRPGRAPHWSGFPDASERNNALNTAILNALEQPIPMQFPNGAPLEDVLKYIRGETAARVGKPIPIYVDPLGLQSAGRDMRSSVWINIEGAPLRNSLARCLGQLDLTFAVRDGFLMITEAGAALPVYEDPFLIVGHCVLALFAAGLGGVLAPVVAGGRV